MSAAPQTIGEIIAAALVPDPELDAAHARFHARFLCSQWLADRLALHLDLDWSDVWDSLCTVPDNMLALLDSPQGWSALANYVAEDFNRAPTNYAPTLH